MGGGVVNKRMMGEEGGGPGGCPTPNGTNLHLGGGGAVNAQLALDAVDVGAHAVCGHAVEVVRDAAVLERLAGGKGLPVAVAALAGVQRGPVHVVGRALVRPEKEQLLAPIVVAHAIARQHQIQQAVHKLLERHLALLLKGDRNTSEQDQREI